MLEIQEMQVQSLGQEDTLEEGMATSSSIFTWRIPRTEEPSGLQSVESQRVHRVAESEVTEHVCTVQVPKSGNQH